MIGMPPQKEEDTIEKVVLQDAYGKVNFYLLPFVKPSAVKQIVGVDADGNNLSYNDTIHKLLAREHIDPCERNVFVSHQFYLPAGTAADDVERMDSEIRTVGNIDEVSADVLEPFDYAALGHIHKPMKAGGETFRYCGTPLACSVSEAGQKKAILMVELREKGAGAQITALPLRPLRNIRIIKGKVKDVLTQACEDYVTVILTDPEDLDVIDMQERMRAAFPYLLEIRRDNLRKADYGRELLPEETTDPFSLCCAFLKELDETEQEILKDVIHTVWEVK